MNKPLRLLASLALAGSALAAHAAATITVINGDPPNVGFNDPTAVAPVGGNSGTTLGQQRLNVYQAVAAKWGTELNSTVPILVYATWEALTCDESSAVLGSAGAVFVNANFPNAPFTDTWYNSALANKLAGSDLSEGDPTSTDPAVIVGADIRARFNANLGNATCLPGAPFYLGLDNAHGNLVDFYSVLLHELGHGLGFQVLTNSQTGKRIGNPALPSMWERFMLDTDTNTTWFAMTDRQRKKSAVNFQGLVWTGASVTAGAPLVLSAGKAEAILNTARNPKTFNVGTAEFGPALTPAGITDFPATIVTQAGELGPGCSPYDAGNAAAVNGQIAVVDRGGCAFVIKTKNAQNAGAVAVVIVNNVAGGPISPAGSDPTIVIPTVGVSMDDGTAIKNSIKPRRSASLTLHLNTTLLAGADASDRVFLYTPNPLEGGSSVSHWDTSATRNLLMEPFINDDLNHEVKVPSDLTLQLFIDIGW
ncbi:MAG: peptidase [Burkholderiales bacterium]|nr:peptidase [Burkholderiales bacterium]